MSELSASETSAQTMENDENPKKTHKKGIIYLSTIPPYMNVTRMYAYFEEYGEVGRIYLQPEEKPHTAKKRKKHSRTFTEGWIEFARRSVAKKVVKHLNNRQVSTRKGSKLYDYTWNMKYLPRFQWVHLNERLSYEKNVRRQRLRAEIAQAKRDATSFGLNVDRNKRKGKQAISTSGGFVVEHVKSNGVGTNSERKEKLAKILM